MNTAASTNKRLAAEQAAYRMVYRAISCFYYASLMVLFVYLCKVIVNNHGFLPSSFFIFFKEALSVAGIWYLFHLCDTKGGLFKYLWYWECSLLNRIRREEALETLRNGGRYFIDESEMTLVDGFLVPKKQIK
jgi:hypothetical protein